MTFRQLEYFVALAEEMHFGRAAERLGIAQAPLSRQIRQLEADLGAVLFDRRRNLIALTQAGERFYARTTALLGEFADMKLKARRIGAGAEGRLRIAFVGSATYGVLPGILHRFRAAFPEVSLSLLPMNNAGLLRMLIRREIDIAIARPALTDPEIVSRSLGREPLDLVAPVAEALHDGPADLRLLADRSFVLYPETPRPSFADTVLDACAAAGIAVTRRIFTMDFQTAIALVSVGEGLCIVPASVGRVQRPGVVFRDIATPMPPTVGSGRCRPT